MANGNPPAAGVSVLYRGFRSISTSTRALREARKAGRRGEAARQLSSQLPAPKVRNAGVWMDWRIIVIKIMLMETAIVKDILSKLLLPYR